MGVKCADWNRNPRTQPQLFSPFGSEMPGQLVAGKVFTAHLSAHTLEKRVDGYQEFFGRKPVPLWVPHPFMAHRTNAAFQLSHIPDAAECGRDHVAMLKCCNKKRSLAGVVTQPMKQLRESPLVGIDTAAPLNRFEAHLVGLGGDLLCLSVGTMIAPKVVFIEWLKPFANRNDAGTSRIQSNGRNRVAVDSSGVQHIAHGCRESSHLVGVRLRSKVRIFATPVQGIRSRRGPDGAALAVNQSHPHTERAEIYPCHHGHRNSCGKRFLSRTPEYTMGAKRQK